MKQQPPIDRDGQALEELKFLIINTPALWRKGSEEGEEEKEKEDEDEDNIVVDDNNHDPAKNEESHRKKRMHRQRSNLKYDDKDGGISLTPYLTFASRSDFAIPVHNTADLALDYHCELFYILDKDTKGLLVYDLNTGYWEFISCILFHEPKAIEVGDKDLYVLDGNRVLVISKINFQTKRSLVLSTVVNPTHLALDNSGQNLYVLDSADNRVYRISIATGEEFLFLRMDNGGSSGTTTTTSSSSSISSGDSVISKAAGISIGKRDGKIYVLDIGNGETKKRILVFSVDGALETSILLSETSDQFQPSGLAAIDTNNVFVGDKSRGAEYYPHPRKYDICVPDSFETLSYSRPSHKLILNRNANVLFVINLVDNWIVKFSLEERYASSAVYVSSFIDSGIRGLEWHKFVMDMVIPDSDNTAVDVSYYASDEKEQTPTEGLWIKSLHPNPWDSLMFDAKGRYLWFRILLTSRNNRSSPIVRSIRAYLPRLSYLRYLPAIYQENAESREFLERYLSLFETFYTQIDEFSFTKYIDPHATPDGFLPWIASWLALAYDENWPKQNFRKLVQKAPQLYKMRGTRKGLEETLLTYLHNLAEARGIMQVSANNQVMLSEQAHNKFMIFESFQLSMVKDNKDYMNLFCDDPYTFCVLLNPDVVDQRKYEVIRKIVEMEKPAHTVGNVVLLQPWFYLGMHTYLGVNTHLKEPIFIAGKSAISRDSVLQTEEETAQVDVRARVGVDSRLS
jgi:phage tail-like protein